MTGEEYLTLDRANDIRGEFVDGEMLEMAGCAVRHSALAVN
jgi:uncharacterized protein YbbC (DUF1343 family)